MDQIEIIKEKIKYAKKIVFFGGAGVSTESGIKDFRSKDGLYNIKSKYGVPYEVMLSHTYFLEHMDTFYQFYKESMIALDALPNNAHIALAEYEHKYHNLTIITQNIDNLHQKAGSNKVIELHGSTYRNRCMKCHDFYGIEEVMKQNGIPHCPKCGGIIKPEVVLYEEPLDENVMYEALKACQEADLMIVGGTSLNVYPAANFVRYFAGNCLVIINKEPTQYDSYANYVLYGNIAEILPKLLDD